MMTENSPSLDGFRMWKSAMLLFVFVSLGECEVQFELWCSMVRHFWCEPNMTPSSSDEIIVYVLIHLNQMWPNDESVSGKNKIYSNVFFIVWKLKTQFELSSSTFSLQFATVITHFTRLDAAMGRPEEKKAIGNNKKWKISTKKMRLKDGQSSDENFQWIFSSFFPRLFLPHANEPKPRPNHQRPLEISARDKGRV